MYGTRRRTPGSIFSALGLSSISAGSARSDSFYFLSLNSMIELGISVAVQCINRKSIPAVRMQMYSLQPFICGAAEEINFLFFYYFFLQAQASLISFNDRKSERLFIQSGVPFILLTNSGRHWINSACATDILLFKNSFFFLGKII